MELVSKDDETTEGGVLVTAGEYDNAVMIWRYGVRSEKVPEAKSSMRSVKSK